MASRNKRLHYARKKRQAAARQLDLLATGAVTLQALLENHPKCMDPVRLWTVMNRTPKLGEAGVKRTLQRAQVWPETKLQDITPEEVERVVMNLPARAR